MRVWIRTILAILLAGIAAQQVLANSTMAAPAASATPNTRTPGFLHTPKDPLERDLATEQEPTKERETANENDLPPSQEGRRPQRPEPGDTPGASTSPAPQPIFIISCNASGCNDNQGNFLTRSGPQRLVGPKGISCERMGGNWQCSAASQP